VQLILKSADLLNGGRSWHAFFQTSDDMALVMVVRGQLIGQEGGSVRNPYFHRGVRIGERFRKHSHHHVGFGINAHWLAEDRGIAAEPALKEAPRQDHDVVGIQAIFCGCEGAP
jgi:hypothetical protein